MMLNRNEKKFVIKWIMTKCIFWRWLFWKKTVDEIEHQKYVWR